VRAVVGFGANMLLAHADGGAGREALKELEFYAHADLFMNPTAEMADIVLPVASAFEREALKIGFDISTEAQSLIQLRAAVAPPPGEARPDTDIIFDLATRLGLGEVFWNGDIDAAYRQQLAPTGVTLEELRATPAGVRVPLQTRHSKYAEPDTGGTPRGFATPSRKVELYSQTFLDHGYAPLPEFTEPPVGPVARPDLAARFPLVLTSAKPTLFCQTQHRALPSLRKRALDPEATYIRRRPRRAVLPPATGYRSRRRRAACAPERDSTRISIRESSSASTGGGSLALICMHPATTRLDRWVPTSICLSAAKRLTQSAARHRTARIYARSDGPLLAEAPRYTCALRERLGIPIISICSPPA
jgi:hypothetical protein